jgi:hypothetical protein
MWLGKLKASSGVAYGYVWGFGGAGGSHHPTLLDNVRRSRKDTSITPDDCSKSLKEATNLHPYPTFLIEVGVTPQQLRTVDTGNHSIHYDNTIAYTPTWIK